jgi:hypothetical protein
MEWDAPTAPARRCAFVTLTKNAFETGLNFLHFLAIFLWHSS